MDEERSSFSTRDRVLSILGEAKRAPQASAAGHRVRGSHNVIGALNSAMGVTRYLLIPRLRFGEARAFLVEWRAYLADHESRGESPADAARRSRIEYIETTVRKRGIESVWLPWMDFRFGSRALGALSSDDLWVAYQQLQAMVANEDAPRD